MSTADSDYQLSEADFIISDESQDEDEAAGSDAQSIAGELSDGKDDDDEQDWEGEADVDAEVGDDKDEGGDEEGEHDLEKKKKKNKGKGTEKVKKTMEERKIGKSQPLRSTASTSRDV